MASKENVVALDRTDSVGSNRQERLGRILLDSGKIDEAGIEEVITLQTAEDLPFGEAALRLSLITADELRTALARQFAYPCVAIGTAALGDELVVAHAPAGALAEEIRTLRTQIMVRWYNERNERRCIAIVSPGNGEGRSYVAANLAAAFAQSGDRTLLIDADLRSPRQHRIFNLSNRVGLATALAGRADHGAVQPIPGFGALSVLPAGPQPPNPQELLLRAAFVSLIERVVPAFDVVLIDTPPAYSSADAQGIALHAGAALIVARRDRTRLQGVVGLAGQMRDNGTAVLGTVYNAF